MGKVTDLRIIDSGKNIFDTDIDYVIPLYQRAFAWEDKQLIQLVEDISDVPDGSLYYIGALIVSKQDNKYEVVDGQQRLTSLFLLLNCLGADVKKTLTFACREKSNYTLNHIKDLLLKNRSKIDIERIEPSIQRGLNILTEELNKPQYAQSNLLNKLERVVLYRIEVPDKTDLNRYFEIMNTRGEQLEQHDILKAILMKELPDSDQPIFARIWDACSDMTGYVQMHLVSKNNTVRENLFGAGWNRIPSTRWADYQLGMQKASYEGINQKINNIISVDFDVDADYGVDEDDARVRFESIIDYPFFLLHTLKVLIEINGIKHEDGKTDIIADLLDDKKLIDSFTNVINHGITDEGRISNNKQKFATDFVVCLLRTRFLFDKYIIKREYVNENSDGEWSLKSLEVSVNKKAKKPYYRNTLFSNKGEWHQDRKNPPRVKENIMIQSALRVSFTSPKIMHWITELLKWLSIKNCSNLNKLGEYRTTAETVAQRTINKDFFEKCKNGSFTMGVNTPHIVFNYLDFLLWYSNRKNYDDFVFEFRNSVEHWYPQNPSEGTFEQWSDGVDRFGNLCIIQRNVNSKFSNMSPEAKKSTFKKMIDKGSLKLRIMRDKTISIDGKASSLCWKETICQEHEDEMIAILKNACGMNSIITNSKAE